MNVIFRLAAAFAISVGLLGCAGNSSPTNFYTLKALAEKPENAQPTATNLGFIGLGPIVLPQYLDRQEIVLPISMHRRKLADFDLWVEPLKANMTRTLAENVSVMMASDVVYNFPWSSSIRVDTQILVDVEQFDGVPGKDATLIARWTAVSGESRKIIATRRVRTTIPVAGNGYEGLASALSQALVVLSEDIVSGLSQG